MQTKSVQEPTQVQISRSLPELWLVRGGSTNPENLHPGESYPFEYRGYTNAGLRNLGPFYFVDAPNVGHGWNVRNASQIVRNLEIFFSATASPEGEIEYTIEYQIRTAGVPILVAYEHRTLHFKEGEGRELKQETSFNYEPIRAQYVIPGSGIETATLFRNYKQISGPALEGLTITVVLQNIELNLNVERT